jgi:hypothetical protein
MSDNARLRRLRVCENARRVRCIRTYAGVCSENAALDRYLVHFSDCWGTTFDSHFH